MGNVFLRPGKFSGSMEEASNPHSTWLNITFKHRSTAYNVLAYYELYKTLPNTELQKKLKEMPHKAAYVLASERVKSEQKVKS